MGIAPQLLSNREKTMLVDALKNTYTLSELLAVLGLARSSYFYHRARLLVAEMEWTPPSLRGSGHDRGPPGPNGINVQNLWSTPFLQP